MLNRCNACNAVLSLGIFLLVWRFWSYAPAAQKTSRASLETVRRLQRLCSHA